MADPKDDETPAQKQFAIWREDPAIDYLVRLVAEKPDQAGLEALLQSAFEAAYSQGAARALE